MREEESELKTRYTRTIKGHLMQLFYLVEITCREENINELEWESMRSSIYAIKNNIDLITDLYITSDLIINLMKKE